MGDIAIKKVTSRRDERQFLTFAWKIYRGDPLWVPPILPEQRKVIRPKTGVFFERGEAEFWTAWRGNKLVGRICTAEDQFTNQHRGRKDCVFGFLEFYNDDLVFDALMAHASGWARQRGLDTLIGPFHLDYEDGYGLLVNGRDRPPVLMCGHTPVYYLDHFERYGFKPHRAANVAFAIDLDNSEKMERVTRLADFVRKKGWVTIREVDWDNFQSEVDNLHHLLDEALSWVGEDRIPWHRDQLEAMVAPFKEVADSEMILFADVDGKTVGWFPGIPNLNEALIKANGLRYPWNYLQLMIYMRKQPECVSVKSVLVLPEYQKTGVAVLLFDELAKRARAKGYKWADLSITSTDNPDTIGLAAEMDAVEYKRWQIYEKRLEE